MAKLVMYTITILSTLTACSGAGGGGVSGQSAGKLNIQSVITISPNLSTTYNASCLYEYGNVVYLVNGNGSGGGYKLDLSTGKVNSTSGLPQINLANGDKCLPNYGQLTWINTNNPYTINIYDPDTLKTSVANLSQAGIAGDDILHSSFNSSNSSVYANNNFLGDGSLAFSEFDLPNPTKYSLIDNSMYLNRNISLAIYGFIGVGGQFNQLIPANNNFPAGVLYVQIVGGGKPPIQTLSTITDTNNQIISATQTAWDFIPSNNGIILTTGAVQPTLYSCPLTASSQYKCNNSYTTSDFTNKYRILRLLGSNSSKLYFLGVNLIKGSIDIFSIQL